MAVTVIWTVVTCVSVIQVIEEFATVLMVPVYMDVSLVMRGGGAVTVSSYAALYFYCC